LPVRGPPGNVSPAKAGLIMHMKHAIRKTKRSIVFAYG
jgi:hypothetical protein